MESPSRWTRSKTSFFSEKEERAGTLLSDWSARSSLSLPHDGQLAGLVGAASLAQESADDQDTAYAAQMARELLFEKEDALTLENFVDVSQTWVCTIPGQISIANITA